jgi:D-alanyl-D-alanine dipeptidase
VKQTLAALSLLIALWPVPAAAKKFKFPKTTRQLVLVVTDSWTAPTGKLTRWERVGQGAWKKVGEPVVVSVGRSGLGWGYGLHPDDLPMERQGPLKSEGDGRAPAGAFKLSELWGYAPKPPEGATLPYHPSGGHTYCVDDPRSKLYNQIVEQTGDKQWASAEPMKRLDAAYTWVVTVDHNKKPLVAGQGSCIFLHAHPSPTLSPPPPTSGCTALPMTDLETLVKWLTPEADPVLVQLPKDDYEKLQREWKLPAIAP